MWSTTSAVSEAPFTYGAPTEILSPSETRRTWSNVSLSPGSPFRRATLSVVSGSTLVWIPLMFTIAYIRKFSLNALDLRPALQAAVEVARERRRVARTGAEREFLPRGYGDRQGV